MMYFVGRDDDLEKRQISLCLPLAEPSPAPARPNIRMPR
jgi:hypothetical protein